MSQRSSIVVIVILILVVVGLATDSPTKEKQIEDNPAPTSMPECRNEEQMTVFAQPKKVVWTGRVIGLMVSGWGIALQKEPLEVGEIPYFAAYVEDDGPPIANEILHTDKLVRVEGLWVDTSGQYGSIFNQYCVPTINIESIELVN